jgi:CRP/FNR family cyclic AMP-dependent transcriptional regulator
MPLSARTGVVSRLSSVLHTISAAGLWMTEPRELLELLSKAAMFQGLARPLLREIAATAREMTFTSEQVIFGRGDTGLDMHVVADGRVRLSVLNPEGRVLAFNNAVRGDVFGEIAAFDGGVRTADATAMTAARTYVLPAATVLKVCTTDAEAARATIAFLCGRIRVTSAQVEDIALHSISARIARFFLQALKMGKAQGTTRQGTIELRFTQAELADLVGASRQKTNLALSTLAEAKAITRRKGVYTCNVPALRKFARAD